MCFLIHPLAPGAIGYFRLHLHADFAKKRLSRGRDIVSQTIRILILTVLPLFAGLAYAQASTSTAKLSDGKASLLQIRKAEVSLGAMQSEYVSSFVPSYRPTAVDENLSFILRVDLEASQYSNGQGAFAKLKAKDEYSQTERWNYGDLFELHGGYCDDSYSVSVGRKLETWAAWDSEWKQGIFQPRYMENRLRSEEAGLTGIFLSTQGEDLGATLALLPAYIPDFGPHFYTKDNKFYSPNPWFHPPTDRFHLQEGGGTIRHRLEQPDSMSVVMHPGIAGKVEYSNKKYLSRLSAAYKPLANLLLAFRGKAILENQETYFQVTVVPRVVYDRVISWENSYRDSGWLYSLGVAYDHPDDYGADPSLTSQQVRAATIFSGAIERQFANDKSSVRLSVLKVHGGDAADSGPYASAETQFERRFQFYEAYSLGFRRQFSSRFDSQLRVIYDRIQQGGVFSLTAGYNFTRGLRAELQADYMGLLSGDALVKDGFFDTYRANDRIGAGVNYVF